MYSLPAPWSDSPCPLRVPRSSSSFLQLFLIIVCSQLTKASAQHLGRFMLGLVAHLGFLKLEWTRCLQCKIPYMAFPNVGSACLSSLVSTTSSSSSLLNEHHLCSTHSCTPSSPETHIAFGHAAFYLIYSSDLFIQSMHTQLSTSTLNFRFPYPTPTPAKAFPDRSQMLLLVVSRTSWTSFCQWMSIALCLFKAGLCSHICVPSTYHREGHIEGVWKMLVGWKQVSISELFYGVGQG